MHSWYFRNGCSLRWVFRGADLAQTARRVGRAGDGRSRRRRSRVCGDLGGRWLRPANPCIHFEMLLGAARAIRFSGIFVAQAGEFVAAVDAVAISGRGSRLNRHKGHIGFVLFGRILQAPRHLRKASGEIPIGQGALKRHSIGKGDRACRCFPAIPSKAWIAS